MENIVFICDDGYALPTAVCIKSIIKSSAPSDSFTIHICTFGLSDENKQLLKGLSAEKIPVEINIVPLSFLEGNLSKITQKTHVSKSALIKLELANIFKNLDKILYMDSDIIVKKSLGSLFKTDISKVYLAASFDYWVHLSNQIYCPKKLKNEEFYFNSGVMLLNLKKMREDDIPSKLWDYKINSAKTKLMDQECLNAVYGKCVSPLTVRYNLNPVFLSYEHIGGINAVYGESFADCGELLGSTAVIHYVGKTDKPWVYKTARLREFWDESYHEIPDAPPVFPKDVPMVRRSFFKSSANRIRTYGLCGFVHFLLYRLKMRRR